MLYRMWDQDKYCSNFFIFYKRHNSKPSAYHASKMNGLFHKTVIEQDKKLQTMKISSLIDAISQNKSYICSTGTTTRFINIDIDEKANRIFSTLLKYNNKFFTKSDLNNKNDKEMLFLRYFLPTFYYETNSSTDTKARIRLVYALDQNVSKELATKIVEKLIIVIESIFNSKIDTASKNIKQIFYGTLKNVFSNKNIRVYSAEKLLEILNYVFKLLNLSEKHRNSSFGITYDFNNSFVSNNYDEALWIYVALSKHNKEHLLITKKKWIKKFEDTMNRRPYFKVKHNTKGYELLNTYKK
ncbi:hypothetical protein H9M94_03130 [Mycoplasma sp. Pen4]|uniref:hypothetical protein n=1 Tax=Mycoplasma sp. Pen4 TaxID=640330 RepID=UPI00165444DE|nr:hypothetical protein [Mycoplasma sp. Pen4]QNM93318.1 hypothetical protein H9M94_01655 [Mycoplasma sp. Pen4]QNM93467.1 hypothetical protein H9M94_02550 [Mycoplasma sp. Pen4]QNM93573.1 hypothetical protein H9M94_03130 [Mycoplasma sp. Pen4]